MIPKMIVGEVSKTWKLGEDDFFSIPFEKLIRENAEHGYRLHSWRMTQTFIPSTNQLVEVIIAVFELVE